MASQWPPQPPPGAGDAANPPPANRPPGQPLNQPPPGQPLNQPPPGQPLSGQPLSGQPLSGRPGPTQQPPREPASDNKFYAVLLAVAAVVVVLGIGGCAVLSAIVEDSVEDTSKTLNDTLRKAQNRNSITDEQAEAIRLGADRDNVVKRFGPPAFGPAKEPALPPDIRDCISWHIRDGRYGATWRFCFRKGKLVSKQSDLRPGPRPAPRERTPAPGAGTPSQEQ